MGWSSSKTSSGGSGGGVQSVTGLNTDNTDPTNPIVQISVDGTTITGAGTPASPLQANFTLRGTNYLTVLAQGTPIENGQELISAFNTAKAMTPNGSPLSRTNRVTIYIASGYFDMDEAINGQFVINTSFIDFVSLSGEKDVYLSSIEVLSNASIGIDILINGIDITINGYYTDKAFAVASSGATFENIVIKNCKGGRYSFGAFGSGFRGLYENCIGGNYSFCYIPDNTPPTGMTLPFFYTGSFDNFGIIRNCTADLGFVGSDVSFVGVNPIVRNLGTIENCTSLDIGFCVSYYTCFNLGTIKNCIARQGFCYSFYATRNLGTIENCTALGGSAFCFTVEYVDGNGLSFNGGVIQNCNSGDSFSFCFYIGNSIQIYSAVNLGRIINCQVYTASGTIGCFCYNSITEGGYNEGYILDCNAVLTDGAFCGKNGENVGVIQSCTANSSAFCSNNLGGIGYIIYRCTILQGAWNVGTTGGGKVLLGIDSTGIVNL
jgi:hypothetical protein